MQTGTESDSLRVFLTGSLPFAIVVAAVLAWPLSEFLLARYRRAAVRSMQKRAAGESGAAPTPPPELPPPPIHCSQGELRRILASSLRHRVVSLALSSLAYSATVTLGTLLGSHTAVSLDRVLVLLPLYAWPGVFLVAAVCSGGDPRLRNRALGAYLGLTVLAGSFAVIRSQKLDAAQILLLWTLTNGPGTLLAALFLQRRIRAVGPLVVAFVLCSLFGVTLAMDVVAASTMLMRAAATVGSMLGLTAPWIIVVICLGALSVAAFVGWHGLQWVGRRYRRKATSDLSLQIHSVVLLFATTHTLRLAFEGLLWTLTGAVAFGAFMLVERATRPRAPGASPVGLLLLRVFALGRDSEKVFDHLNARWRDIGPVNLVAGPDLITSTVEPHEMLAFASGTLARQYLTSPQEVETRAAQLDFLPDRDGRYRVNELFCQADTWQHAVSLLIRRSHVVVMDLRRFTEARAGCRFELEILLRWVPKERFFLLADESSQASVERILSGICQALPSASPNFQREPPRLLLLPAPRHAARTLLGAAVRGALGSADAERELTATAEKH